MNSKVFTRLPNVLSSVVTIGGAIIIGFIFGWQLAGEIRDHHSPLKSTTRGMNP